MLGCLNILLIFVGNKSNAKMSVGMADSIAVINYMLTRCTKKLLKLLNATDGTRIMS